MLRPIIHGFAAVAALWALDMDIFTVRGSVLVVALLALSIDERSA